MEGLKSETASKELNEEDLLPLTDSMKLVVNALLTLVDTDAAFPEVRDFHLLMREVIHELRGPENLQQLLKDLSKVRIPRIQMRFLKGWQNQGADDMIEVSLLYLYLVRISLFISLVFYSENQKAEVLSQADKPLSLKGWTKW